jgi:uncharacterized protein YvpB
MRVVLVASLTFFGMTAFGCGPDTDSGATSPEDLASNEAGLAASVLLDVPWIGQNPELPRGCEVTALAMVVRYAGLPVTKMGLASDIDKVPYLRDGLHGNPNDGFVGDMYTFANPGYGAYHPPVMRLAKRHLGSRAIDLSGSATTLYTLLTYVAQHRPVWVITNATFAPLPSSSFETWHRSSGDVRISWEEHAVVITGYDSTHVFINDPLDAQHGKNKRVDRSNFRLAWEQMGHQAITYQP